MIKEIRDFFLGLFFPSFCLGCNKEGTFLCQDCRSILEISEYHYCLCGKNPLRLPPGNKKGTCQKCRANKLSGLYFALAYKEKSLTRKLIHQFKYEPYIKTLAGVLSSIIIEHLVITKNNSDGIWQNAILIPVPLEKSKLKNRGYNQAQELAKELSKILEVNVISGNLIKTRKTLSQKDLSAKERQENIKGAFLVKNPIEVKNKKIFLVDDVYTTGSTMEECANVLKKAGAIQVWGITIARED